jgi:endonuclease III
MTKKQRFKYVLDYFSTHQPDAQTELEYQDPYQLVVAVILSAQCTDKRVNIITPEFFRMYPSAKHLAKAEQQDVYEVIKSCSYPNSKAANLVGMARKLNEEFGGILPSEVDKLIELPGVGRKTANVIASVIFNQPALAVDTHVFRVAARIGLTTNAKTPLETEKQLLNYIPVDMVSVAHHWLILHGRYTCQARRPKCEQCPIKEACKYYKGK